MFTLENSAGKIFTWIWNNEVVRIKDLSCWGILRIIRMSTVEMKLTSKLPFLKKIRFLMQVYICCVPVQLSQKSLLDTHFLLTK